MRNYAMSLSKLADRNMGLESGCVSQDEEDAQFLLQALRELVARLTASVPGAGAGEPDIETGPAGPADLEEIERWEGDEYFYLEAALPGSVDAEIDVNINGGRAFIRMARF